MPSGDRRFAARSEDGLQTLVDEIRRQGGQPIVGRADVSDFEQVKAVADRTVAEYGRLDTWAHISGVGIYARLTDHAPDEFKRVIDVNLIDAMAALPHLKHGGARQPTLAQRGVGVRSSP